MSTVLASDQTAIAYVEGEAPKIRPVRPADAPALALFFRGLSQESRYRRFHAGISEIAPDLLERFTHPDPRDELALVAVADVADRQLCVGEARYASGDGAHGDREFAVTVDDRWQRTGIGTRLLECMIREAGRRGVERLYGDVLRDNLPMIEFARRLGFAFGRHPSNPMLLRIERVLHAVEEASAVRAFQLKPAWLSLQPRRNLMRRPWCAPEPTRTTP